MKHHAPQFSLPLPPEDFRLIPESTADGAAQVAAKADAKTAAAAMDAAQIPLLDGLGAPSKPAKTVKGACEFTVRALRETAPVKPTGDTPEAIVAYYRAHIATFERHNPDVESFYVVLLNTRRRIMGHVLVATGTLDTILVHPREVFRAAIVANASAIVLMHNHPSGDPSPSEADIKVTRDLVRGGQLLKIEVLDHIIIGDPRMGAGPGHCSLRELGYFSL